MTCYEAKQHNIDPWVLVVPHTHTNAGAQEEAGSKGQQANKHLPAQHKYDHPLCILLQGWLAEQLLKKCPRPIDTAAGRVCSAGSNKLQPGGAALYCALSHVKHGRHAKTAHELCHGCHNTAWLQVSRLMQNSLRQHCCNTHWTNE